MNKSHVKKQSGVKFVDLEHVQKNRGSLSSSIHSLGGNMHKRRVMPSPLMAQFERMDSNHSVCCVRWEDKLSLAAGGLGIQDDTVPDDVPPDSRLSAELTDVIGWW